MKQKKPPKDARVSSLVLRLDLLHALSRICCCQQSLLEVEERAVLLAELDHNGGGGANDGKRGQNACRRCGRHWYWLCCDIGSISIMFTVILILVGVVLLVVVRVLGWPIEVDQFARYVISAGVFGLITGGTNAVALFMLLYRIPLVCGSGSVC